MKFEGHSGTFWDIADTGRWRCRSVGSRWHEGAEVNFDGHSRTYCEIVNMGGWRSRSVGSCWHEGAGVNFDGHSRISCDIANIGRWAGGPWSQDYDRSCVLVGQVRMFFGEGVRRTCSDAACFGNFGGDKVAMLTTNTSHRGSLSAICGQDHDTGCALRPRMALCGEGSVVSIRNLSMRGLLDARDRSRGARGNGVCRRLRGAGEDGSASDCGSVADIYAVYTVAYAYADSDTLEYLYAKANSDKRANSNTHRRTEAA